MANNIGVRQYLQSQGLANEDINYDKGSGYVTAKGQNFIKPAVNLAGTSYDSKENLDAAYGNYTKPTVNGFSALPGAIAGAQVGIPSTGIPKENPAPTPTATSQYSNPYTQQIAELMKHLSESNAALNQPVDVYSTPQYAAAKAAQDRNAHQSILSGQEAFGQDGMARSSDMARFAQNTQNSANDYLATQLVPQIIQQIQAQKQQEYQNRQSQFNNVLGLSDRADSQHQNEINNKYTEAGLTGTYNPTGQSAEQIQAKMDANSKAYGNATPEEQIRLHDENVAYAAQLGKKYDSGTGTYSAGQGFAGQRTVAGQQLDNQVKEVAYNHARDSLLDKRYVEKFNQDIKQQGFENALKIALQKHQISNDNAQIAISRQNAANSRRGTDASIANMAADNKRQDNAVKLSVDGREAQGLIAGDLSKLTADPTTAEANLKKYFDSNAGHFVPLVTAEIYEKMKQQALAPYQKITAVDKQDLTTREKAIKDAQNDDRWLKKGQDKAALIAEYEAYYK